MSIESKRKLAGTAFVALLVLSVFWPSPIVSVNRLCCNASLGIDELSFLGREQPRWDVAFWCLAGLFALALFQTGDFEWRDFRTAWHLPRPGRKAILPLSVAVALSTLLVAFIWHFVDRPVTAWAERIQSDTLEDVIRIANRLGGGANPGLIVLFFLIAGVVYRHRRWIDYGMAMTFAGAGAGIAVQVVKYLAGRTRPELWLGPFHHARVSATSFPSGHTVGAFALAGVLMLTSPSKTMRIVAFLLAFSIGLARVLAFRHWTSDVVASAILGLVVAWVVTRVTTEPDGIA
ncbi:MAG: putative Phosphoesterase, PA-phosphatase related (rane associated) [Acidobacteria bacterium]|nr:putative Phosphoesterase, PA-phosphatase related (rane associated) [Acidobacteriota bacterium]